MPTPTETYNALTGTLTDLAARIDDHISALISEATQPPPQPPPVAPTLLVGATIDPFDGLNYIDSIARFEQAIGAPLHIIRDFDGGDPPLTYDQGGNHWPGWTAHTGKRHRICSVKGWNHTFTSLRQLMMSFPDDGYTSRFIVQHEADNRSKGNNPADFKRMCAYLHEAWDSLGRPTHIIPAFCLMGWWDRDPGQAWPYDSSASWFPDPDILPDFEFLFDPYDENGNHTLAELCAPTLQVWRNAGGGPWGLAEWGTKLTGSAGATFIRDGHAYLRTEGATVACYFHSSVGSSGPWWFPLTDPQMVEAFRNELTGT